MLGLCQIFILLVMAAANVIDIPNPPELLKLRCNMRDALLQWKPTGDNGARILDYSIEYNTSFTPDNWDVIDREDLNCCQFNVPLSPWTTYTFRVIARNKFGQSLPSQHSQICTTPHATPYKNPENVEGKGTTPRNLVINWTPMPEIDHNAPGIKYRVYWKRDDDYNEQWNIIDVVDWQQNHTIIENQPTFKPYLIKVEAYNSKGQASDAAYVIRGWSGEDVPQSAPKNLTMMELKSGTTALISWIPVDNEHIRGHLKGYKIQTWSENEGEEEAHETIIDDNDRSWVDTLIPVSKNFVRVLAFNGAYDGPPSETIFITTPEGTPGPIDYLEAFPMGNDSFFLTWKPPNQPNGRITGYNIFYQEVQGMMAMDLYSRDPPINDPSVTTVKLASLKPDTKYRINVMARTWVGIGMEYYIERSTGSTGPTAPGKPTFTWEYVGGTIDWDTGNKITDIKITWIPDTYYSNLGTHFYVQYKLYGKSQFQKTRPELYNLFTILKGLDTEKAYEMKIVAVDGEYETESDVWVLTNVPLVAPKNLTVVMIRDATTALLTWIPIANEHFEGYKILTWTEDEREEEAHVIVKKKNDSFLIDSFIPFSTNFVRVLAYNGPHDGPPSETIKFITPEGVPGPIQSLKAIPMGSTAFLLTWEPPKHHNGILTGYIIYFQEVQDMALSDFSQRDPSINDPTVTTAKLSSLKPNTTYRITIKAKTAIGNGDAYFIERSTKIISPTQPGAPTFTWQHMNTLDGESAIKIIWVPNIIPNPGTHFYVQYKLKEASQFESTRPEYYDMFTVLRGLSSQTMYDIRIVAIDGEYETYSETEEILAN